MAKPAMRPSGGAEVAATPPVDQSAHRQGRIEELAGKPNADRQKTGRKPRWLSAPVRSAWWSPVPAHLPEARQ